MKYTNSSLVSYTKISPFKNKRNQPIAKITPHHMAGNGTLEGIGREFTKPNRYASSNYAIDSNGKIGLYVPESYRAWTSGSPDNDYQAVTIEVANDSGAPDWHVSNKALASLITLCTDICIRNNIEELVFTGNASGNLTQHNYFQPTLCPGPYLSSKFPYIQEEVNKRLKQHRTQNVTNTTKPTTPVIKPEDLFIKEGDLVKFTSDATQYNGKPIPKSYKSKTYQVKQIRGDRVVLTINNIVMYAVHLKHITKAVNEINVTKPKEPTSITTKQTNYRIRITEPPVEYRAKPDINSKVTGTIKSNGIFTIVKETSDGWGLLKSGAGWVYLASIAKI